MLAVRVVPLPQDAERVLEGIVTPAAPPSGGLWSRLRSAAFDRKLLAARAAKARAVLGRRACEDVEIWHETPPALAPLRNWRGIEVGTVRVGADLARALEPLTDSAVDIGTLALKRGAFVAGSKQPMKCAWRSSNMCPKAPPTCVPCAGRSSCSGCSTAAGKEMSDPGLPWGERL